MFSLVLICRHNKNIISLPIMPTKAMLFGGIMDLSAMQNSSVFTISPGPLPTKKKFMTCCVTRVSSYIS